MPQPADQYQPTRDLPRRPTNGFAISSLVLGIVWIWWIGSILALVFGYIALRQIDESGGAEDGRGMAIAGITLGWVGVGVALLMIGMMVFGVMTMPGMSMDGPMSGAAQR